jgi:hypothetical protein
MCDFAVGPLRLNQGGGNRNPFPQKGIEHHSSTPDSNLDSRRPFRARFHHRALDLRLQRRFGA